MFDQTMNQDASVQDEKAKRASSLVSRNITVTGHRTSMRLEPAMWNALIDICRREKMSLHQLCSMVSTRKPSESSLTAAMRVFAMHYFRVAATEEGHRQVGHGSAFSFSAAQDFAVFLPHNVMMVATTHGAMPQQKQY